MSDVILSAAEAAGATPIRTVRAAEWEGVAASLGPVARQVARLAKFQGKAGQTLVVPGAEGKAEAVLLGLGEAAAPDFTALRALPAKLPPGDYSLEAPLSVDFCTAAAVAWAL